MIADDLAITEVMVLLDKAIVEGFNRGITDWLKPIPFLAEDFGDLSAAFIPMFLNRSLDQVKIGLVDGPISDGDGQPITHEPSTPIGNNRNNEHIGR